MEEQSGREFASTNPTTGTQDAALQEPGLSPEIPLNPRRRLQHFRRPAPPHVSSNAPHFPRRGVEHVARGGCGRLNILETPAYCALCSTTRQRLGKAGAVPEAWRLRAAV